MTLRLAVCKNVFAGYKDGDGARFTNVSVSVSGKLYSQISSLPIVSMNVSLYLFISFLSN